MIAHLLDGFIFSGFKLLRHIEEKPAPRVKLLELVVVINRRGVILPQHFQLLNQLYLHKSLKSRLLGVLRSAHDRAELCVGRTIPDEK